jgi:hypothetical protein
VERLACRDGHGDSEREHGRQQRPSAHGPSIVVPPIHAAGRFTGTAARAFV